MKILTLAAAFAALAIAQTPQYPGTVATDTQLRVAKNAAAQPATTLAAAMGATDTSFQVALGTPIPVNGLATICSASTSASLGCTAIEIVSVCNVVGTVVTVGFSACPNLDGRGFDSSAAAFHPLGSSVFINMDAWHHNALAAEVKAIETALGPNLSHVAGSGIGLNATTYNFTPQSPGGSLSIGSNTITLAAGVVGIAGTDVGHNLYITGGTGSAEKVLITGGTYTSGGGGTVIVTAANTHTGAWTIGPASGGIQEAVCGLPSYGGTVWVTAPTTLLSDVSPCGKWPVTVLPVGALITYSGFIVFGNTTSGYYSAFTGSTSPTDPRTAWLATIGATFGGAGNTTREVGINGMADAATGSAWGEAVGVWGHVTSASNLVNAVGGSFEVRATGAGTVGTKLPLWGINTINEDGAPLGSNYANVLLLNELDFNVFNTSTKVLGLSIGGNGSAQPASSLGYICNTLGVGLHWDNCFVTLDGVSPIGLQLGTVATGNTVASQQIILFARNGGGTSQVASFQENATGSLLIGAPISHNFSVTGTANAVVLSATGVQLAAGGYYSFGTAATGAVTATLGTNAPAGVATTPYTWLKVQAPDGTLGYVPMYH